MMRKTNISVPFDEISWIFFDAWWDILSTRGQVDDRGGSQYRRALRAFVESTSRTTHISMESVHHWLKEWISLDDLAT